MDALLNATDAQMATLEELVAALGHAEATLTSVQAARDGLLAIAARMAAEIAEQDLTDDGGEYEVRAICAEIGAAVRVSDRTIQRRMADASWYVERFPRVWAAQGAGLIGAGHARVIVEAGAHLDDPADRDAYAVEILPFAQVESPNRVRRVARRIAERFQPCTVTDRHQAARATSAVWVTDRADGMSELGARGPSVLIHGIYDRLTRMATTVRTANRRAARTAHLNDDTTPGRARTGRTRTAGATGSGAGGSTGGAGASTSAGTGTRSGTSAPTRPERPDPARPEPTQSNSPPPDPEQSDVAPPGPDPTPPDPTPPDPVPSDPVPPEDETGPAGSEPDGRSIDQLRADLLADLLLTGTPHAHDTDDGLLGAIKGHVEISVPALTLIGDDLPDTAIPELERLGITTDTFPPAELDGVCPIDTDTARTLAGLNPGWNRVLTHPITGGILTVDRYRPSKKLTRKLKSRDQRCRFPGCGIRARKCDLDHTIPASAGGPTSEDNLGDLCRRHHFTKHHTPWQARQLPGGLIQWQSPTGQVYIDTPPAQNTITFTEPTDPANPDPDPADALDFAGALDAPDPFGDLDLTTWTRDDPAPTPF